MTEQPTLDSGQTDAIKQLTAAVEKMNNHRFIKVQNSLWRLLMLQLARGLAFGLGTALGASLLVSAIGWWLTQFEFVPILGEWAAQILEQMELPE